MGLFKTKLKFGRDKVSCSNEEIKAITSLFKSKEEFIEIVNDYTKYLHWAFNQYDTGHPHRNLRSAMYNFGESKTQVGEPGSAFSKLLRTIGGNLEEEIKKMQKIIVDFSKMYNKLERNKKDIETISGQRDTDLQKFLEGLLETGRAYVKEAENSINESKNLLAN